MNQNKIKNSNWIGLNNDIVRNPWEKNTSA